MIHHKKEESSTTQKNQMINDGVPPKPEERWHYIKELENRQLNIRIPSKPSFTNTQMQHPNRLTDKQRQLLIQMKGKMHQQHTQRNEALPWNKKIPLGQHPSKGRQQYKQQWIKTQSIQQPEIRQPIPITINSDTLQKDKDCWVVQCGSFKNTEQAETMRAQMAFTGFDVYITTNNNWNRVVIGPLKGKDNANNTIARLKGAGHTNCILRTSRG